MAASREPVNVPSRGDDDELDIESVQSSVLCRSCKTYGCVLFPPGRIRMRSGLRGYGHEHLSQADLMEFMTQYRPDAEAAAFTVLPIGCDVDRRSHLKPGSNSQHTTSWPWRTRPYGPTPTAAWRPCEPGRRDGYLMVARLQPRPIERPADSQLTVYKRRISRWNMRRPCVTCPARVELVPSPRAETSASALGSGDRKDNSGNVQFYTIFPASCTCGV